MNDAPKRQSAPAVLIAASGTGGHLFPALHIAQALKRQSPGVRIEFIGSGRPLEESIIGGSGFKRHVISTVGLKQRGLKGLLEYALTFPKALCQVWRLISDFRPSVVVGVGGYVSFIPVTLARLRGIPTWIHEAELKPGLANAVLSRYAGRVSLAFENAEMPRSAKTVYTGHPVREELCAVAAEHKEVSAPRTLLVVGGSQGARALDLAMLGLADFLKARGLSVWHQCRAENEEPLKRAFAERGIDARVVTFIEDMTAAYRWADLIVARAGASSIMEIGAINRPAIFVPFPHAQGQHQTANAKVLCDDGKALLVEEGEDFHRRLQASLETLLDPQSYAEMRARPVHSRGLEAADMIAKGCLALID